MKIEYDDNKRHQTLEHRGLDFAFAGELLFSDLPVLEILDDREDYGEDRWQTMGPFRGNIVLIVWTQRDDARRIISMRKCNEREQDRYYKTLAGSG